MKLVRKRVTEQDTRFYREIAIETPYGKIPKTPKKVVYDEDSDFYLYYILGPGYKKIGRPMCFGYVWQGKTGYVSVYYTYIYDREAEGYRYTWEICGVKYDGKSIYLSDNQELGELIEQAIIATNGCFSVGNVISNTFGIVNDD